MATLTKVNAGRNSLSNDARSASESQGVLARRGAHSPVVYGRECLGVVCVEDADFCSPVARERESTDRQDGLRSSLPRAAHGTSVPLARVEVKCTSVRALFSATLPETVEQLARSVLRDPLRVTVGERNVSATSVEQKLLFVDGEDGKLLGVRQLLRNRTYEREENE